MSLPVMPIFNVQPQSWSRALEFALAGEGPSIAPGKPPTRVATTSRERAYASAMGSSPTPVSLRKSLVPKARRNVPGACAMRVAASIPIAVSMSAKTGMPAPARIAVRVTWSGSSVLGNMIPLRPGSPLRASKSSSHRGVVFELMRTHPAMSVDKALTTLARAWSLETSGTAASRSKITESASLV